MIVGLIGYRGAGKSTVARHLAQRLGCEAIDADEFLEARAGKSIREIFAEQGEEAFRNLESDILADLVQRPAAVLALGGGVVLRPANRRLLERISVVWLDAPAECLHRRIEADATTRQRRPNLTPIGGLEEIRRLLAERHPLYQQVARWRVEVHDKAPAQVAEEIWMLLEAELSSGGAPTTG
jgi:shikimate kinase